MTGAVSISKIPVQSDDENIRRGQWVSPFLEVRIDEALSDLRICPATEIKVMFLWFLSAFDPRGKH